MNYTKIALDLKDQARRTGPRALFYTWWGTFVHSPHSTNRVHKKTKFDKYSEEYDLIGFYDNSAKAEWIVEDMKFEEARLKKFIVKNPALEE